MGKSPASVYEDTPRPVDTFDEAMLRKALTVQVRRRVRRDSTLPMDGTDWQTDLHFLAGRVVTVSQCLVDSSEPPWIEHEGKEHRLHPVDAKANAHKPRTSVALPARSSIKVDPPKALLNQTLGKPKQADEEASS
jgi:hypothetical protein